MIKVQNKIAKKENCLNNQISTQYSYPDTQKEDVDQKPKTDFTYRENTNLIKCYGPPVYNFSIEIEKGMVIKNLYEKHDIEDRIRTKMVDWMVEVLTAYKSDPQTLFLSVALMDMYIKKCPTVLETSDIHLIGITCMYIMSKFEDIVPIRILSVYQKISHRSFSEYKNILIFRAQVREQERQILFTLNWDIFFVTCYDFIRTYIFDFVHNNNEIIKNLKMEKTISNLENIAFYLGKLGLHIEEFVSYE
jgi:hypothetical protein